LHEQGQFGPKFQVQGTATCVLHCFVIVSIILLIRKGDEMNCSIYWLILA